MAQLYPSGFTVSYIYIYSLFLHFEEQYLHLLSPVHLCTCVYVSGFALVVAEVRCTKDAKGVRCELCWCA